MTGQKRPYQRKKGDKYIEGKGVPKKTDYSKVMKLPRSKEEFFYWSYITCVVLILLNFWLRTGQLPVGSGIFRLLLISLIPGSFVFVYWLFIRWVASIAERAGRSFVAFMILAILAPAIAWIVVIMFKKPQPIASVVK